MVLMVTSAVREKLEVVHGVTLTEVEECFRNLAGRSLRDTRERHRTRPPTLWFIAQTDSGRVLKVVFIPRREGNVLRSAFEPADIERAIYSRYGSS